MNRASHIRNILTLLLTVIFLNCFGQKSKKLEGRIVEFGSKKAIPFATIKIQEKNNGVIANLDGYFVIPKNYKSNGFSIVISCIGYETLTVNLKNIKDDIINIINLYPKNENLETVVISSRKKKKKYLSPYTIVKKAISLIPENVPSNPYSMIHYYRDYHIVDNKYFNVNEAIVKSYDYGIKTDLILDKKNRDAVLSIKRNTDFSIDSTLLKPYDSSTKFISKTELSGQGGNELGILKIHDPIRNYNKKNFSFIDYFKDDFLSNHELTNIKYTYIDNVKINVISFKTKPEISGISHSAFGNIYISDYNFRIFKFDYEVYNIRKKERLFQVNVEYKSFKDKMYLNYITYNNKFVALEDDYFGIAKIEYIQEESKFNVVFNARLKTNTVQSSDFKFRYGQEKVLVQGVEVTDDYSVEVKLMEWTIPEVWKEIDNPFLKHLTYKIKNIRDVDNRKVNKIPEIEGYHFRELFVQEIIEKVYSDKELLFADRNKSLFNAPVNNTYNMDDYWVNSMLKNVNKI